MTGPLDSTLIAELSAGVLDIVLLKASVLVLTAAVACRALRRSSAAVRHGIWAAAFLGLLALPVLRPAAPGSSATVVGLRAPSIAAGPGDGSAGIPAIASRAEPGARVDLAAGQAGAPPRPSLTTLDVTRFHGWIVGVWLVGLVLHLGRFGAHLRAAHRLSRRATPCADRVRRRVRTIASRLGLRGAPTTLVSPEVAVPSTLGAIRPTLILPPNVHGWSTDRLEAALLHELVHLRRRDYVMHLIATGVRAIYWINPAVWYAGRRLEAERERACDDGVVVNEVDPIRYAEYLMCFAWSGRDAAPRPLLLLAGRSSLTERIGSLLDRAQARAPLRPGARIAIAAAAASAVLSAGSIGVFGVVPGSAQHVAALSSPDPLERRHLAWELGEVEDPAGVDALIELLSDPDPRVRGASAWALGEIKDPRAVRPLATLMMDDHALVREMAALAIGEIEEPAGLAALREAGSIPEDARAWAIAQIERAEGISEVFAGSLVGPPVRASELPRYVEELGEPDPRVRALAAEKLGVLGAVEAVDPLLDALADDDSAVRAAAVWALDEINPSRQRPVAR